MAYTYSIVPFIRYSVKKYFTDFPFFLQTNLNRCWRRFCSGSDLRSKHFPIRIYVHPCGVGKWLKEAGTVQKNPNIPLVWSLLTVYWRRIGQNNGIKSPYIQYSEEFLVFLRVNAPEKLDFGYLQQDSHWFIQNRPLQYTKIRKITNQYQLFGYFL